MQPHAHFALFGLPPAYALDQAALKTRYLELQRQHHPDQHASAPAAAQKQAAQRTADLNQAYQTLRCPLQRALYLLDQAGHPADTESQTHQDPAYLADQLELREKLASITPPETSENAAQLAALRTQAETGFAAHQQQFQQSHAAADWPTATAAVHKMMFAHKLLAEIDQKEEALAD
ncbi:MAG: Fe-S protein assembly co-chaperone HscB [Cellvibrionales bacterium]|nr:Fe-S protein assembly co-chaperone HscB [Cellvibrionales bacterium]